MTATTLLIAVNYGTPLAVVKFFAAARRQAPATRLHVAVTDNSGCFSKGEYATLRSQLVEMCVDIVEPGENLGYFGGANAAYRSLAPRTVDPDFTIVANTDLEFVSADLFDKIERLPLSPDVMAIGPQISRVAKGQGGDDRAFQENPLRTRAYSVGEVRLRTLVYASRVLTNLAYLVARWRRRQSRGHPVSPQVAREVYMIHGSFMIFPRAYFASTRGLAYPSFLFGEEIFVAEEIRRAGGRVWFEPSLKLRHVGGETTDALPSDRRRLFEYQSFRWLLDEYFAGARRPPALRSRKG